MTNDIVLVFDPIRRQTFFDWNDKEFFEIQIWNWMPLRVVHIQIIALPELPKPE